jgi:uncharacterized protein (TIGR03083 family)
MTLIAEKLELVGDISTQIYNCLSRKSIKEWDIQTPCDLWQVGDVVAHLLGGAERHMASLTRAKLGEFNPPTDFVSSDLPVLSDRNAQRDKNIRSNAGDNLLELFKENYAALHKILLGFTVNDWDLPCWHARSGTISSAQYLDLRVQELVVHQWDIFSSLDDTVHVDPKGMRLLFGIANNWLGMTFRPSPPLDMAVVYRFNVDGIKSPVSYLICYGDRFEICDDISNDVNCDIYCDAETYILFIYGRLKLDIGIGVDNFKVYGNSDLLGKFESWFKGL